jgi:hypothetical protein
MLELSLAKHIRAGQGARFKRFEFFVCGREARAPALNHCPQMSPENFARAYAGDHHE